MANGVILYEGLSKIDGQPIVAIATGIAGGSSNAKTGTMVQVWIIRSDIEPMAAIHSGQDKSICGNCVHRGTIVDGKNKSRSCYVLAFQAPTNIYRAYKAEKYRQTNRAHEIMRDRFVRLGAYGDPAAVPLYVWGNVLAFAKGHTAYTHQWRDYPELQSIAMASVDTLSEYNEATAQGWRTFRVTTDVADKQHNEFVCPASEEKGKVVTCSQCLACGGLASANKASVTIKVHGVGGKQKHFTNAVTAQ